MAYELQNFDCILIHPEKKANQFTDTMIKSKKNYNTEKAW